MCPHTICVLILLYMCPHTTICMCPHTTICVLMLLCIFPHTTTCMCPHTTICMCPHTTIFVSSYYYVSSHYYMCPHTPCVLILLYMPSLYSVCVQGPSSSGGSSPQPHSRILQLNRVEQDFGEVLNLLAFCWHQSTNTGTKVQILTQKALPAAGLD